MPESKLTLTFGKEDFFLITESLRAASAALASHPEATEEHRELRNQMIQLGERMLSRARIECRDW